MRLLDARQAGVDEEGLRGWARAVSADRDAPHVARSYRYPYALVAWHSAPVGVDIERVEPCDTAFADLICTPDERELARRARDPDAHLTALWSAKEALAKALGDALLYEPSRLESPLSWPDGCAPPWRARALRPARGHVGALVWRAAPAG